MNRAPAPVETFNDLDGEVVNFFKVLREQKDALLEQLAFTPYSRGEFITALMPADGLSDLERARRFFVRIRQVRTALPNATPGRWGYVVQDSRHGMSIVVSRFYHALDKLADVALRFQRAQLESLPAIDLISRYDSKDTLFYLDPPYTPDVCFVDYKHVMTLDQHRELIKAVRACIGKVAISGYDNALYTELLSGWHTTRAAHKNVWSSNGKERQEVLWTNYDPAAINPVSQLSLFDAVTATA